MIKQRLRHTYHRIKRKLWAEINLIDIGSAGDLPEPWRSHATQIRHLLKFEPRDSAQQQAHITTVDAALWSANEQRPFYIYKGLGGTGSSLFEQNYDYVRANYDTLKQRGNPKLAETWFERSQLDRVETIACRTLDDVLAELKHPFAYHFMKIDAQGAEYEILSGAEHFLKTNCVGLELELFSLPLYKGIKLLDDVQAYLANFGFELVIKKPAHGSFDSQNDCVFLKSRQQSAIVNTIRKIYGLTAK